MNVFSRDPDANRDANARSSSDGHNHHLGPRPQEPGAPVGGGAPAPPIRYLAPLSDDLLRLCLRGLALPPSPRVLDLCCGLGPASAMLVTEFGASYTGLDLDEGLLRVARQQALEAGLQERVEFRRGDARHIELPNGTFDLVLALGGCLTYMGRPEGLERIRQLLAPRGSILISDLITLDSPVPGEIDAALEALAPNSPPRGLALEPAVRDVYEEGLYRFENESSYRSLFSLFGYDLRFDFLVPESAWNAYYRHAARVLTDPTAEPRVPVAVDELAAFYSWGGRWGLGYLVAGASLAATSEA